MRARKRKKILAQLNQRDAGKMAARDDVSDNEGEESNGDGGRGRSENTSTSTQAAAEGPCMGTDVTPGNSEFNIGGS